MIANLKKKRTLQSAYIILAVLLITSATMLYYFNYYLNFNPLINNYQISASSFLDADGTGALWLVDNGSRKISRINSDLQIDEVIKGGKSSAPFFFTNGISADTAHGKIYASNIYLTNSASERYYHQNIVCLTNHGNLLASIYQDKIQPDDSQTNSIEGLRYTDGKLIFYDVGEESAKMFSFDEASGKTTALQEFPLLNDRWSSIVFNPANKETYISYFSGEIISHSPTSAKNLTTDSDDFVPFSLTVDNAGNAYFFDSKSQTIRRITNGKISVAVSEARLHEAFAEDSLFVSSITVNQAGLYAVSGNKIICFHSNGFVSKIDNPEFSTSLRLRSFLAWTALLIFIIAIISVMVILYIKFLLDIAKKISKPLLLGLLPIMITAMFIIGNMYNDQTAYNTGELKNRIEHLAVCVTKFIDADHLHATYGNHNYENPEYRKIDKTLTDIVRSSSSSDLTFYGSVYLFENGKLKCLADTNDAYAMGTILSPEPDTKYMFEAVNSGEEQYSTYSDIDGEWLGVAVPLFDSQDKVVGVVEVDCDMVLIKHINYENILLTILKLISLLYITFLLTSETAAFFSTRKHLAVKGLRLRDNSSAVRIISFLPLFSLCLTTGFIALLINRYDITQLGINKEMAIGIAVSVEFMANALINIRAGSLASRFGWKPQVSAGLVISALATLVTIYAPSATIFLCGRALNGLAFGIVLSGIKTFINAEDDEQKRTDVRPESSAGKSSGGLCGLIIGLWLYEQFGLDVICFFAVIVSLAIAFVIQSCFANRFELAKSQLQQSNFLKNLRIVFSDKSTVLFILVLAAPIALFYATPRYIVQVYVSERHYPLINIGWAQLISEFATIYFGKSLMQYTLKRFNIKQALIVSTAIIGIGHLVTAIGYNLPFLYAGMFILGIGSAVGGAAFAEYSLTLKPTLKIGRQAMTGIIALLSTLPNAVSAPLIGKLCGWFGLQYGWIITTVIGIIFLGIFALMSKKN